MKILVIGGTVFVGRHIIQSAINHGHEVTMFNRGQANPELFPTVTSIRGDRAKDLDKIGDQHWDAVIDTCGYLPRVVQKSCEAFKYSCDQYVFISTGSVYKDTKTPRLNENAELATPQNMDAEEMKNEIYGELKVGCEQVVQSTLGSRALIIRPGLIVGPYDSTDRFTYWPVRFSFCNEVLAPGSPDRLIQFIDARDLAEFTISLVQTKCGGRFNAVGPEHPLSMSRFLDGCNNVAGNNSKIVWASEDFLSANSVNEWADLPLWLSEKGEASGFLQRDNTRAKSAGLSFRSLEETITDTLHWWRSEHEQLIDLKTGLSRGRENALLAELP